MIRKVIHLVIIVLFVLFAIAQFNDPDPLIWVLIYGLVAAVAILRLWLPALNLRPLILTLIVLNVIYAAFYIPLFVEYLSKPEKSELFGSMIYDKPWIEGTREFLGLLIAIGALVYLRSKSTAKS